MKPILFNTDMVQAIRVGRKTVTRRLVKFLLGFNPFWTGYAPDGPVLYGSTNIPAAKAPYKPGEILYVRETWRVRNAVGDYSRGTKCAEIEYAAGGETTFIYPQNPDFDKWRTGARWHPSIFMPKEAARIFLRVTSVRAERLKKITPEQAVAEGAVKHPHYMRYGGEKCLVDHDFYRKYFARLWDSTIKSKDLPAYGWDANPWVWVIEFERCEKPEQEGEK